MGAKQSKKAPAITPARTLTCQALIDECKDPGDITKKFPPPSICAGITFDSPMVKKACDAEEYPLATAKSFEKCYQQEQYSEDPDALAACMQTFLSNSPALQKLALAYVSKNDLAGAIGPRHLQLLEQGKTDWIPDWIKNLREGGLDLEDYQFEEPTLQPHSPPKKRVSFGPQSVRTFTKGAPVSETGGGRKTRRHKRRKGKKTRRNHRKQHTKRTYMRHLGRQ